MYLDIKYRSTNLSTTTKISLPVGSHCTVPGEELEEPEVLAGPKLRFLPPCVPALGAVSWPLDDLRSLDRFCFKSSRDSEKGLEKTPVDPPDPRKQTA